MKNGPQRIQPERRVIPLGEETKSRRQESRKGKMLSSGKEREARDGITQEFLQSILIYDTGTGKFYWKSPNPRSPRSFLYAGCVNKITGYIEINIRGKSYRAHRLAWIIENGSSCEGFIDHINGDRKDNRISNLRESNYFQNCSNRSSVGYGKLGIRNVMEKDGAWMVRVCAKGHRIAKTFRDLGEAVKFAKLKRKEMHGEFSTR